MEFESVIEGKNIQKGFKNFTLNIPELKIPKGFATALIGENGAGKTTLLNILAGIRIDNKGTLKYFDAFDQNDRENNPEVKERIGYTGTENYFLPHWTVDQVRQLSKLLYKNFDEEKYKAYYDELAISANGSYEGKKKISELSDGTKTKLTLAAILSRETDLLIMDEPASPLDPLMRDKLCEIIRTYISSKEGRSVFFSTHNISDMENVTDYAIIMEHGAIVEQGFVEDLKEKYILVKGEASDANAARNILYTISEGIYGFEGICLSSDLDKLAGMDITTETASLFQISVAVMKKNTRIR
ncbi:MAG: ABC transporter ATP-binding protein [Lachnospiraceae bacterium]|nr:ABC transporter ATP-binding protein [Lachnospiraceae bacterium]